METGGEGDYRGGDELKNMEDEEDRIDLDLETQPHHGSGLEKDLEYSSACREPAMGGTPPWIGLLRNLYWEFGM
jgi:hypothetical protein